MPKMKVVQVPKAGADFEIAEREIPLPGPLQVRIRVLACGVCHSDVVTKDGLFPGISYPRVPGHEVAGVIDEVGAGVSEWKKGERVGVGWHGGGVGPRGVWSGEKFGDQVAAVGRAPGNAALTKKLGAAVYIDSAATDPAAELQKLGGASVILATATSGKAMSAVIGGLGVNGTML